VLDTNVLLHDPSSLFRFEEHDVYLPMMTLEELDGHKTGTGEIPRNARQVSRSLDVLIAKAQRPISVTNGVPLSGLGDTKAKGKLYFQMNVVEHTLPESLPTGKADNQILGVVKSLKEQFPERDVILVSKDINMRVKARALGLLTEDYTSDKTLTDAEVLYSGTLQLPRTFFSTRARTLAPLPNKDGYARFRYTHKHTQQMLHNQLVYLDGDMPFYARVESVGHGSAVLRMLQNFALPKHAVWGITARNPFQNFALELLVDHDIDLVTIVGQAGTGKTLLALAAGLAQVFDQKFYSEIIVTRATVPIGEDIGFLPGTEEEKMGAWMGAFEDNLEVLTRNPDNTYVRDHPATLDLIRSCIRIKSMNYMRGRTFLARYLIIDECQNLTPKQMKTLITRAGKGTKVVCLGNMSQIDTPYLTEGSSGLAFAVDRFKGWPHYGHVILERGERSRLADFASEML
jgi:PhoH-like ATPase